MNSFLKGHKEHPGGSVGLAPCLVNTDHIELIFPKQDIVRVGQYSDHHCLATLRDGSTVELECSFYELETIMQVAHLSQLGNAELFLKKDK